MVVAIPVLLSAVGVVVVYAPSVSVLGIESRDAGLALMLVGLAALSLGLFLATRRAAADKDEPTGHR